MGPSVSILIPAHDAAAWVGDAVESALGQTWTDAEILVLDDGSTDGTADVLRGFGSRIAWERTPHAGANAARNRLLARSRGTWLQFLDADDVLLPTKIEAQLAVAGDADFVVSPYLDERGRPCQGPVPGGDAWVELLRRHLGTTTANLFRRSALERVGGWDAADAPAQEYRLMFALLRSGARWVAAPEPLCIKRKVNPRSVWLHDRAGSHWALVELGSAVVRDLGSRGELDRARRDAAGGLFLDCARWFGPGSERGRATLEASRAVGIPPGALRSGLAPGARRLARWVGVPAALRWERLRRGRRSRSVSGGPTRSDRAATSTPGASRL